LAARRILGSASQGPAAVDTASHGREPRAELELVWKQRRLALSRRRGVERAGFLNGTLLLAGAWLGACSQAEEPVFIAASHTFNVTYVGSLSVPEPSAQQCGLNVPGRAAEYTLELQAARAGLRVYISSFGCAFQAERSSTRVFAANVSCELDPDSSLHSFGVSLRTIESFELDTASGVLQMFYTDLIPGAAGSQSRLCGIVEGRAIEGGAAAGAEGG
jgi:hypothetical protein